MKKKRRIRGFTMAELLIVVAIIVILGGVSAVAVQRHQRSLALAEVNTVAKEIFFAAQNHLTAAESQGYLNPDAASGIDYGESNKAATASDGNATGIYYFAVPKDGFTGNSVLDYMLPFASIEETVRTKGNYVIRYQANPARVLDVWYGRARSEAYTGNYVEDPASLIKSNGIQDLFNGYKSKVIGYYGGDTALESGVTLNSPYIEVENAERLTVTIDTAAVNVGADGQAILAATSENPDPVTVKLLVTGETSKAMAAIPVLPSPSYRTSGPTGGGSYTVVLDDITLGYDTNNNAGGHFAEIKDNSLGTGAVISAQGNFIPGENITVQAVAFSTQALANIAYSNAVTTNSLFADLVDAADAGIAGVSTGSVALIANFRHLENLDKRISAVDISGLTIVAAKQTEDLVWAEDDNDEAFTAVIPNASIYQISATDGTAAGCYQPVNLDYALVYAGADKDETGVMKCHTVTGVKVGSAETPYTGAAGLFGDVTAAATIRDLELIDFEITATGSAGALAGAMGKSGVATSVTNVLARNSASNDAAKARAATITSAGSAGGLIGSMTGTTVEKCAAALVVSAGANAGGLIGESHGSSRVTASYSGGHTIDKKDTENKVIGTVYAMTAYNVTAPKTDTTKGNAGGLIGDAGTTDITNCYSTCSVSGKTAGGLTGCGGKNVDTCYATGLVDGATAGAFAGEKRSTVTGCLYFEIINLSEETVSGVTTIKEMPPVPGQEAVTGITALDADLTSYAAFIGAPSTATGVGSGVKKWTPVVVKDENGVITERLYYDQGLESLYQNEFNLKTVAQLGATVVADADASAPADFVAAHYGDWPAPETLVVNH